MHLHKKLGIWLPVGGHIDRDELPQDAALREIREESGLDVELFNPEKQIDMGSAKQLLRPMRLLLEDINEFHQHIDFIYFVFTDSSELSPHDGEATTLKWFTANEIKTLKNTPGNVKELSAEAISLFDIARSGRYVKN